MNAASHGDAVGRLTVDELRLLSLIAEPKSRLAREVGASTGGELRQLLAAGYDAPLALSLALRTALGATTAVVLA